MNGFWYGLAVGILGTYGITFAIALGVGGFLRAGHGPMDEDEMVARSRAADLL